MAQWQSQHVVYHIRIAVDY